MREVQLINDPNPVEMPLGLPFIRKETNSQLLRAAWKACGANPTYPLETRGVFSLATICGYDLDRPALDYVLKRGYCPMPAKERGQYVWTEKLIVALFDSLEQLRRWRAESEIHRHKMTADEIANAQWEVAKYSAALEAFKGFPAHELIDLLAKCDNPKTCEIIAGVLKTKLGTIDLRGNESVPEADPAAVN